MTDPVRDQRANDSQPAPNGERGDPRRPGEYDGVGADLALHLQRQIGASALALGVSAQAVASMCDAIACREVERLKAECRADWERRVEEFASINNRLKRLEDLLEVKGGVPWPPTGTEREYSVVAPDALAARVVGTKSPESA